jgi:hypothetical protein
MGRERRERKNGKKEEGEEDWKQGNRAKKIGRIDVLIFLPQIPLDRRAREKGVLTKLIKYFNIINKIK